MMNVRPAQERGHAQHGWLDSHHTFSFADYYDPKHMGFRSLRVINDDRVQAARGFGTHSHANMEIISYVLEGALQHRDSMGTGSVIRPGDVQKMSAGSGVSHSEYNASPTESVHFLQIWIVPNQQGIAPSYEQQAFTDTEKRGQLRVVASPDGRQGSLRLQADAVVYSGLFNAGETAELALSAGRHAWVQVARGQVRVNGRDLGEGDGAALSDEPSVRLEGIKGGEVIVFDLA
jgi:redox-sensitive bicupin YhaK (pirin superfamily)